MRSMNRKAAAKMMVYYEAIFPNNMDPALPTDWHRSVAAAMPPGTLLSRNEHHVILEWIRDDAGVRHIIGIPWPHKELIGQLIGAVPGLNVKELDRHPHVEWTTAREYGISNNMKPLDVDRLASQVTATLTAGVYEQKPGDAVISQLLVAPTGLSSRPSSLLESGARFVIETFLPPATPSKEDLAHRQMKQASPTFKATLRIAAKSDTEIHAKELLRTVRRSYTRTDTAHVHLQPRRMMSTKTVIESIKSAKTPFDVPAVLNSNEVIAFSAWPVAGVQAPGLTLGKTRQLPPSEVVAREGTSIGLAAAAGYKNRPIAIPNSEMFRHNWIIGPTGSGKTELQTVIARQKIDQGDGVIVIDTKGDSFRRTLDHIPAHRVKETIVIDLSDKTHAVGFNALHDGDANATIDALINLFIKGTPDPKLFNQAMMNGLRTLRTVPGTTIVDLIPLLDPTTPQEIAWAKHIVDGLPRNSPEARWWQRMYSIKDTDRKNRFNPVLNRLWKFDSHESLRRTLGQSNPTFSLREAIRDGKIILVYAPATIGSDEVTLFVSLFIGEVFRTVMELPEKKPTHIILDEVQRLKNMPIDLADALSVVRSKSTSLTMGHQYIAQLSAEVKQALSNTATKIAYRLDGPDAREWVSMVSKSISPEDVMNLDPFQAIARVATVGGVSEPIAVQTQAAPKPYGLAATVLRESQRTNARPAADIDREVLSRRSAPTKARKKAEPTSFGRVRKEGN